METAPRAAFAQESGSAATDRAEQAPEMTPLVSGSGRTGHGDTRTATLQPDESQGSCGAPTRGVWLRYTPPADSSIYVSVAISSSDPALAPVVELHDGGFGGDGQAGSLIQVACGAGSADHRVIAPVDPERVYFLMIGSTRGAGGAFTVTLHEHLAPPNDSFAAAAPATAEEMHHGFASWAGGGAGSLETGEPQPSCGAITTSVWYRVTADQRVQMTTINDIVLAAYEGTSLADLTEIDCDNTVESGYHRDVELPRPTGAVYYIQVGATDAVSFSVASLSDEQCTYCLAPCADSAYNLYGKKGHPRQVWLLNPGGIPRELTRGDVEAAIRTALSVISNAANDCGMVDQVDVRVAYSGTTSKTASACAGRIDDKHVIQFKRMTTGPAGLNCQSTTTRFVFRDGRTVTRTLWDSDILIDIDPADGFQTWTIDPEAESCVDQLDLVAILVHELGHSFGIDHVRGRHGNQTMATGYEADNGTCSDAARTLGRGDVLALQRLY